jgi:hypothetical protein
MNVKTIETLIMKNKIKTSERWYPQPVEIYKAGIKIPHDSTLNKRLLSNFAYSMQY